MPFKDEERNRSYFREYMKRYRQGLTGESLNPIREPEKFKPNQPHRHCCIKIDGTWRRVAEQAGRIYDRDTGELLHGFIGNFP